jgi:preprotein translocase subunit SecF
MRALERLMDTGRWRNTPETERDKYLATGADRELFAKLAAQRNDWLSEAEREFVEKSDASYIQDEKAKQEIQDRLVKANTDLSGQTRRLRIFAISLAGTVILLLIVLFFTFIFAKEALYYGYP